jgi:hypothetical protein
MFSLFFVLCTLCLPVTGYLADNNSLAKGVFLHSTQLCARSFARGFISVFAGTYLCEKSIYEYFNVSFRFLALCTSCLHVSTTLLLLSAAINKRIIIIIISCQGFLSSLVLLLLSQW